MDVQDGTSLMSAASYEEAKWRRVIVQSSCGIAVFVAVLIVTRVWTSVSSTRFLRRRQMNKVDTWFCVLDILTSSASQCCFIAQVYIREYNVVLVVIELAFAIFYGASMYRRLWLKNFNFSVAFTAVTFLDCYSIGIALYQEFSDQPTWLTPLFVRSMAALIRYKELMNLGLLNDYFGEVKQRLILSMFRFLCVTFFFASGGFVLEILGDLKIDWDRSGGSTFVEINPDYETTLMKQIYFVVVTLSTVGYGDITPSTSMHQAFAIVMIVTGVAFFSSEVRAIIDMHHQIDSGKGQYRRSRFRNYHILVLGGAVASGSSTLEIFLEELLHPSRPTSLLPDVVLMTEHEPSQGLRRVITSPLGALHVKYIRGSPMDQSALLRADAANADMAFVLSDLSVLECDSHAEDEDTILRASLLQRQLPDMPVRLLLIRPWAKEMAKMAGINPMCCVTAGALNFARMALSVRCPGVPVLLTTMYSKLAGDWSQLPSSMKPWVREYFTSMRHDVYGAQIGEKFHGMPFLKAAAIIYEEHDVNLLAVQTPAKDGGRLCPAGLVSGHLHILCEGDVVMCLGQNVKKVLRAVGREGAHPEEWRREFHRVRRHAAMIGMGLTEVSAFGLDSKATLAEQQQNTFRKNSEEAKQSRAWLSRRAAQGADTPPQQPSTRGSARNSADGLPSLDEEREHIAPTKSGVKHEDTRRRNLTVLNSRLNISDALHEAVKTVEKKRETGQEESDFTPWHTVVRIAKNANEHIVIVADGEFDQERWEELEVLLYRLRGNDGCNIKPIIILSTDAPAVQHLILWRTIDVYVTEGSVSDENIVRHLNLKGAHTIIVLAEGCTSHNPLLMDRAVLMTTSVLERNVQRKMEGMNMNHEAMLRKVVLEFHHPKSVWHVHETRGFSSLASSTKSEGGDDGGDDKKKHTGRELRMCPNPTDASRRGVRRSEDEGIIDASGGRASPSSRARLPQEWLSAVPPTSPKTSSSRLKSSSSRQNLNADRGSENQLPKGWESMQDGASGESTRGGIGSTISSLKPVRYAVEESQKDTRKAKCLRPLLKFFGFLDRDGKPVTGSTSKSASKSTKLSWFEHPEAHTQYASGKVMFKTEVSRVMATVFYTPGLMELVDSLTRDAKDDEDVGHHPRIWNIPLPAELHGKTMGEAFQHFAGKEALVIGVFRGVRRRRKDRGGRRSARGSHHDFLQHSEFDTLDRSDDGSSSDSDGDGDDDLSPPDHSYVLTAPPHNVRLTKHDGVYVIATTDWAWSNAPELVKLRKVAAVITLQRQVRAQIEKRKATRRDEILEAQGFDRAGNNTANPTAAAMPTTASMLLSRRENSWTRAAALATRGRRSSLSEETDSRRGSFEAAAAVAAATARAQTPPPGK